MGAGKGGTEPKGLRVGAGRDAKKGLFCSKHISHFMWKNGNKLT